MPRRQSGAYLLEALIGILIFALGILGIVGLQAASLRTTNDSSLRAEAVFAANQLLGDMWTKSWFTLQANYDSSLNGPGYQAFVTSLQNSQLAAWDKNPVVDFATAECAAQSNKSVGVKIVIYWKSTDQTEHSYETCGIVGQN
jgi:type IV pilus assembly protein PilV